MTATVTIPLSKPLRRNAQNGIVHQRGYLILTKMHMYWLYTDANDDACMQGFADDTQPSLPFNQVRRQLDCSKSSQHWALSIETALTNTFAYSTTILLIAINLTNAQSCHTTANVMDVLFVVIR